MRRRTSETRSLERHDASAAWPVGLLRSCAAAYRLSRHTQSRSARCINIRQVEASLPSNNSLTSATCQPTTTKPISTTPADMSTAYKVEATTQLTFDGVETCTGRFAARLVQTDASTAQPAGEELSEVRSELTHLADEAATYVIFARNHRSDRERDFVEGKRQLNDEVDAAARRAFGDYDWLDFSVQAGDETLLADCKATQDDSHVYRESTWRAEWVPVTLPDTEGQSVPTNNQLEYDRMVASGQYDSEELEEQRGILGLD